jgi:hypothetical protein
VPIPDKPRKLQDICKPENPETIGAQRFDGYMTPEKLQNLLQKARFFVKEVIPDFQTSPKSCKY